MEPKKVGVYLFLTLLTLGCFGYSYLTQQNGLTELKMEIPQLMREMESLRQEIAVLEYQVEAFQSPRNLLQLAAQNQFRHLKLPSLHEVAFLGIATGAEEGILPAQAPAHLQSKVALASSTY